MAKIKLKEIVKKKKKTSEFFENADNQKSVMYTSIIAFALIFIFASSLFGRVNPSEEVFVEVNREEVAANPSEEVITFSTREPSEEIPSEDYFVSADLPKEINIPSVNIKGFVQQVGIDKDNEMVFPNNIHVAGWYINSIKPGEKGLSIINGHVDGVYSGGIFYNLHDVSVGEEFTVFYGDGVEYRFRILDKVKVSKFEANNILFSKIQEIESQLNLITSSGDFFVDTEDYDQRLIVISERI